MSGAAAAEAHGPATVVSEIVFTWKAKLCMAHGEVHVLYDPLHTMPTDYEDHGHGADQQQAVRRRFAAHAHVVCAQSLCLEDGAGAGSGPFLSCSFFLKSSPLSECLQWCSVPPA